MNIDVTKQIIESCENDELSRIIAMAKEENDIRLNTVKYIPAEACVQLRAFSTCGDADKYEYAICIIRNKLTCSYTRAKGVVEKYLSIYKDVNPDH
jgi:hypothetical protein